MTAIRTLPTSPAASSARSPMVRCSNVFFVDLRSYRGPNQGEGVATSSAGGRRTG